jgi:hypothetical protein
MLQMRKTQIILVIWIIKLHFLGGYCNLQDSFKNGGGSMCETITFVGLPATHSKNVLFVLKSVLSEKKSQTGLTVPKIIAPTGKVLLFGDDSGIRLPEGQCTIILYRDFRNILCSVARHHGYCQSCSATAMEVKIKHWTNRLFSETDSPSWHEWLPRLKKSGALMLRYECLMEESTSSLKLLFQTWLGVDQPSVSVSRNDKDRPVFRREPEYGWQSCFTDESFKVTGDLISDFIGDFGYNVRDWSDATCDEATSTLILTKSPVSSSLASLSSETSSVVRVGGQENMSPEKRLNELIERVGPDLKVISVDHRFASRLKNEDLKHCTRQGCLPDFITIGAQKGGTTSLYHYLKDYHPNLETSKLEELNFFSERSVVMENQN